MATKPALWLAGLLAISGISLHATAAQVYKWTDSEGVTHYSENPPPSNAQESSTIKVKTRLPEGYDQAQENRQKALDAQKEKAKQAATSATNSPKTADKSQNKERCVALRANLETMTTNPRVRVQDEKTGEIRVLPDEEKNKQMAETRNRIKEEC